MKVKVEQSLHGYRLGHNLLSASVQLDLVDSDRMAMLSDWSEYTNERDDSYITAYPLVNKPYYVIAKTWYANEMERPGCVWTHSLLISNEDLVKIKNFPSLLRLFKRPVRGEYGSYADAIELEESEGYDCMLDLQNESNAVEAIYDRIIQGQPQAYRVEMESQWYQSLCLQLMNYLQPELLAKMSISTGCSYIRSFDNRPFDLQFVSGRPDIDSVFQTTNSVRPWISFAAKNISENNLLFSQLIKLFSTDMRDSRSLLDTYWLLITIINQNYPDDDRKKAAIATIFSQLAMAFPDKDQGRIMKERFMQIEMTRNFTDDVMMTIMLCCNKEVTAYYKEDVDFQERLDAIVASEDRTQIIGLIYKLTLMETNEWGKELLSHADKYLTNDVVDSFAQENWQTLEVLFGYCPSILNYVDWTLVRKEHLENSSAYIAKSPDVFTHWQEYTKSALAAKALLNYDFWSVVFSHENHTIALFLDHYNNENVAEVKPMHERLLSMYKLEILNWMKNCSNMSPTIVETVMFLIPPTSIEAKKSDIGCWRSFAKSRVKNQSAMLYYAYLYVLSFNWPSNFAAIEMLKQSFYPLYKAAAESRLDERLWQSVSPFTDELPIWFSWDKCKKMRKKVGKRLALAKVDNNYIMNFTFDQKLNEQLLKIKDRAFI